MEEKQIKEFSEKALHHCIYTIAAACSILYFNLGRAYKGEYQDIYIIFAALCLFDLVWYIIYFSNEIKFFTSLFQKIRFGLKGTVLLNAIVMATYGPNESWLLAIVILIVFYLLEKSAYTYRLIVLVEKDKAEQAKATQETNLFP